MSTESMVTQGHAGDAIDFALGHCGPDEALAFLDDWRADRANEWPGYVKWLSAQYRHRTAAQPEREDVLEEGNKRGLYDTTKIGPELVAFLDDRGGMLAALRDEMSEGYRGWLDDAVGALQIARDHLAALTTPAPAVSTDDAIEQIVVGFSDKAILRLDIEEDDPRLSRVCDDMRQTVRAILSRLRGEG